MTVPLRQAAGDQAGDKDLGRRNRALGLLVGDPVDDRARPDYATSPRLNSLRTLYLLRRHDNRIVSRAQAVPPAAMASTGIRCV